MHIDPLDLHLPHADPQRHDSVLRIPPLDAKDVNSYVDDFVPSWCYPSCILY